MQFTSRRNSETSNRMRGRESEMSNDEVAARIKAFIGESFLDGDPKGELQDTTPLLEWEVLNSMNSALLLNFLREEMGVYVPLAEINQKNFRDIKAISKLVSGLMAVPVDTKM
jgi:clorobiocin biosynthesis protein CloN5